MKKFFQKISQTTTGVIIIVAITLIANAFTEPSQAPPGGNVSAPLNTSATTQTKTGKLLFPWFEDQNQPGYFVDPGGNSQLWRLYVYSTDVFSAYFAGNVGIGTAGPLNKLHVYDATAGGLLYLQTGGVSSQIKFQNSNNQSGFIVYDGTDFDFFANSGSIPTMSITGGAPGNVGIGTTDPTQKLDVAGNVKGTGLCIGTDCRTSWPSSSAETDPIFNQSKGINVYSCPVIWVGSLYENTCVGQLSASSFCQYSVPQGDWPSVSCAYVGKLIQ